ncbi:MAG: hypothetical protein JWP57_1891, partial [Spirosoma sp.]|nr:hypothetical protein [Spirosoma sp.]
MNWFICLFLLLFSPAIWGQTVVSSVQEALSLARRSNPDLINARQNRLVQEQQRVVSQAALMPSARLFTNADYNYALPVQLVPAEFLGGRPGEIRSLRVGLPIFLTAGAEVSVHLL